MRIDYTSKQLEDLLKQYQTVASEANAFMVDQVKWGTCNESSSGLRMPTHLLSEGEVEERFVGVPMSCHFQKYCPFRTTMTVEELRTV